MPVFNYTHAFTKITEEEKAVPSGEVELFCLLEIEVKKSGKSTQEISTMKNNRFSFGTGWSWDLGDRTNYALICFL